MLEVVDLVPAIALVANQTPAFEGVHELLRLELGALEDVDDRDPKGTLAANVANWRHATKAPCELASQLI
jgi:hypothetical protein